MNQDEYLLAGQAIETRYEDMLGPLMPYCIGLSPFAIKFKLPRKLLSDPANFEFYQAHFKGISVDNDVQLKPETHMTTFDEYELGEWMVVTLEFKMMLPANLIQKIYELTDGSFLIERPPVPDVNPFTGY